MEEQKAGNKRSKQELRAIQNSNIELEYLLS